MTIDPRAIKLITLVGDAGGIAFPVAAPFIAIVEELLKLVADTGTEVHQISAEQSASQAAGMAAHDASLLTSERAKKKG